MRKAIEANFLEDVFQHMMAISKGKCTLKESMIEQRGCEMERKILFGLLYMFEDLELYKSEFEYAKESEYKIKILEEKNREIAQFNYVASHDLQEPLRTVISFSELLKKNYAGKLGSDADTYLSFIVDSSVRMQKLINGLLEYSKIGADKNLVVVDCNKIITEIISDFDTILVEVGGKVISDPLPKIYGFELELRQLLQNLISNGLKFSAQKEYPIINIKVAENQNEYIFSVSDNGMGIDKKYHGRIFGIFQRLHNKEAYKGTGIGLATCQKIVEMHGGRIWVESAIGEGSNFYFTIPKKIKE